MDVVVYAVDAGYFALIASQRRKRFVPGQTTREQVLQIAGGNPEEFEQLLSALRAVAR